MRHPTLTALSVLSAVAAAPGAVSVGGRTAVIHHAHAKTEEHRALPWPAAGTCRSAFPWPAAGKYRGAASQPSQAKLRRGQRRRGARRLRLARQGGRR